MVFYLFVCLFVIIGCVWLYYQDGNISFLILMLIFLCFIYVFMNGMEGGF